MKTAFASGVIVMTAVDLGAINVWLLPCPECGEVFGVPEKIVNEHNHLTCPVCSEKSKVDLSESITVFGVTQMQIRQRVKDTTKPA